MCINLVFSHVSWYVHPYFGRKIPIFKFNHCRTGMAMPKTMHGHVLADDLGNPSTCLCFTQDGDRW